MIYKKYVKRLFDLVFSVFLLIAFIPFFILISILVLIFLGRPIFFSQKRPGLDKKIFKIYKFRSMINQNDINGKPLPDLLRLTRFGAFLRRSSLDELPELFNVLIGDMSLVGPRPLLLEYLPLYSYEQARRHEVLPGITGWAQINGRNLISWNEKFKLDIFYVDHISFVFDIKILILTFWKIFSKDGINANVNETMPMFTGSINTM